MYSCANMNLHYTWCTGFNWSGGHRRPPTISQFTGYAIQLCATFISGNYQVLIPRLRVLLSFLVADCSYQNTGWTITTCHTRHIIASREWHLPTTSEKGGSIEHSIYEPLSKHIYFKPRHPPCPSSLGLAMTNDALHCTRTCTIMLKDASILPQLLHISPCKL